MKIEIKQLTAIILITLMILPIGFVGAVPEIPHQFYGDVTIDGVAAPDGNLVEAKIAGITYESESTVDGKYGYTLSDLFYVLGDDSETTLKEGGVNGDTVEFYVNGILATTYVFESGGSTELNLECALAQATVSTDKASYLPDELVTISGVAEADAWVAIDVKNPMDSTIYTDNVQADGAGDYETILSAPSMFGIYTVYVSITGATASTTFTVVISRLPAEITNQETLDSTGASKTSFASGETVLVSAGVSNVGTESQSMLIVVQLKDPDYRVLAPSYISVTLEPGQSLTPSIGFVLPMTGYTTGTWTAKVMVFDDWPALGGVTIGEPVTIIIMVI